VLGIIGKFKDKCVPIFSGGTSLSKGYGLIERFSEDLDFKMDYPPDVTRDDFRNFRKNLYKSIEASPEGMKVIKGSDFSRNESRFFGCSIEYPKIFTPPASLRPHVKLEFSARKPYISPEDREIRSFVTQIQQEEADLKIKCIRPIETAADKLSAFIWRVLNRKRGDAKDDPALIRHLHDLAKLTPHILKEASEFWGLAKKAYAADLKEGRGDKMPEVLIEAFEQLIAGLKKDPLYKEEYIKFVSGVSYEGEDKQTNYEEALKLLNQIRDSQK